MTSSKKKNEGYACPFPQRECSKGLQLGRDERKFVNFTLKNALPLLCHGSNKFSWGIILFGWGAFSVTYNVMLIN